LCLDIYGGWGEKWGEGERMKGRKQIRLPGVLAIVASLKTGIANGSNQMLTCISFIVTRAVLAHFSYFEK
jgi:hypothetical protein